MSRKIEVVPYNINWPEMYEIEARKIREALGECIIAVHHIGSTSIPGIKAKPILDILGEVMDIEVIDSKNNVMKVIGYEARGEYGIPGRRYFVKHQGEIHTHHIHIYQVNHTEIQRHIFFRDYLRTHPKAATRYGNLKEQLAIQYPFDSASYTDAKTEIVREIDKLAAVWFSSRN